MSASAFLNLEISPISPKMIPAVTYDIPGIESIFVLSDKTSSWILEVIVSILLLIDFSSSKEFFNKIDKYSLLSPIESLACSLMA